MPTRDGKGTATYTEAELRRERACWLGSRCQCDHDRCYNGMVDPEDSDDGLAHKCTDCKESQEMHAEANPPPKRRR